MKSFTIKTLSLVIACAGAPVAGFAAEQGALEDASVQAASPLAPLNVEPDHGQGLGPEGRDLHFDNTVMETPDEDTELFLQTLEPPPTGIAGPTGESGAAQTAVNPHSGEDLDPESSDTLSANSVDD